MTARVLLAQAQQTLREASYQISTDSRAKASIGELCFVAEDPFGVVLLVTYETWSSLLDGWQAAQGELVRLLNEKLTQSNPKAWEGYLALLTPSPSGDERAEDEIRYDTLRVRKIVGTGESIHFIGDLTNVLMPLLPLSVGDVGATEGATSVVDRLADMLIERGVKPSVAHAVVEGFKKDEPLLECIAEALMR